MVTVLRNRRDGARAPGSIRWLSTGVFSCSMLFYSLCSPVQAQRLTSRDVVGWEPTPVDARIAYGDGPLQFGELRLPEGEGPFPVAVVVHGGCWLSQFDRVHIGRLATALTSQGIATWSIEYRRIGDDGGGWPGTFEDVARGADHLRVLAADHPLDLDRVLAVGHSAGGHFVLWLAGRTALPEDSVLAFGDPLRIHAVLALSPATDVAAVQSVRMCGGAMAKVMGGSPADVPAHYRDGSPIEMPALQVPQVLIVGRDDMPPIPPMVEAYAERNRKLGDQIEVIEAPESGHFEMIDPSSTTWPLVREAVRRLLGEH